MNNKNVPFYKKTLSTEKRNSFLSALGLLFIISMFFLWLPAVWLFIKGGIITKLIIVLLLIYQYFFADKNELVRKFIQKCNIGNNLKSFSVIIEDEIKDSKSLICFHPHGMFAFGMGITMISDIPCFKNISGGGTSVVRMLPVSGIIARWFGITGVNNNNFKHLMQNNKNIGFIPGGFECASITDYKRDKVFIKNRKGFIKYALQYGYRVHPTYTFNENRTFYTINGLDNLRIFLNKFKIPGVLFYGRYFYLPLNNVDVCVVIGTPIDLPIIKKPTEEDVNKYHQIYINSLTDLYNRYKKEYNCSEKLEIV